MLRLRGIVALGLSISSLATTPVGPAQVAISEMTGNQVWNFDSEPVGSLPKSFKVGTLFDGRPAGDWRIMEAKEPPSPSRVLAQLMNTGAEHAYKTVFVEDVTTADLDLRVSFLAVGGKGDMGGGLIWRAADDRNYYLARANPLEQNIRAYRVVKGVRHLLGNFDEIIPVRKWHTLRVVAQDQRFEVFFEGHTVLKLSDKTFSNGRIGLWTKSDAVTYFDDLQLLHLN